MPSWCLNQTINEGKPACHQTTDIYPTFDLPMLRPSQVNSCHRERCELTVGGLDGRGECALSVGDGSRHGASGVIIWVAKSLFDSSTKPTAFRACAADGALMLLYLAVSELVLLMVPLHCCTLLIAYVIVTSCLCLVRIICVVVYDVVSHAGKFLVLVSCDQVLVLNGAYMLLAENSPHVAGFSVSASPQCITTVLYHSAHHHQCSPIQCFTRVLHPHTHCDANEATFPQ